MLEYDGGNGNPSDLFLSGQTTDTTSGHRRNLFDPYTPTTTNNEFLLHQNGFSRSHLQQFTSMYDDDPSNFYMDPSPAVILSGRSSGGVMDLAATLGLELGRGANMSLSAAAEDDPLLYRRSGFRVNAAKCQAERCNADLRNAKHYHRRHKVCEFHSKAATVIAAGLSQRFCQQCSRFHLLSEFDGGKRSCRERLADHNRRRRKIHREAVERKHGSKNCGTNTVGDSEVQSPSSGVTVGISPPRMLLDSCFARQMTVPSPSTNALFLSTGLFGWSHDQS